MHAPLQYSCLSLFLRALAVVICVWWYIVWGIWGIAGLARDRGELAETLTATLLGLALLLALASRFAMKFSARLFAVTLFLCFLGVACVAVPKDDKPPVPVIELVGLSLMQLMTLTGVTLWPPLSKFRSP
jgi:CDP-diglyceride synthetase